MFVIPIQFSKISHATWSVLDYSINIYSLCQLLFWVFLKLFFGPLSLYPLRLFHCPLKVHFLSISLLSALLYYHPFPSIGKSYSSGLNGKLNINYKNNYFGFYSHLIHSWTYLFSFTKSYPDTFVVNIENNLYFHKSIKFILKIFKQIYFGTLDIIRKIHSIFRPF